MTTETFSDAADLGRRVQRRLQELAAEAVCPWVKLGDLVFRADEIVEGRETATSRARTDEEIAHRLQELSDQRFGRLALRFTYAGRVLDTSLATVRRVTRAGGGSEVEIELEEVRIPAGDFMRAGTSGLSADDLVELGMKNLFLGEPLPEQISIMGLTETGINSDDLRQAFDLPNEIAGSIVRLVTVEGLVGSGRATRLIRLELGPRTGDLRRILIEWETRPHAGAEPARRSLEGAWVRP